MIEKREIKNFWIDYTCLMLNWTSLSILAFFSTAVVWAFILKHYFNIKKEFWLLNDTVDGDFGAKWWLKREALKPSLWSAFLWWKRNHSWNWIRAYNPPWKAGAVDKDENGNDIFWVIKCTVKHTRSYGRWTRADKKKKIYGTNYFAYQINGRIYCQFSHANKLFQIQMGAGGNRYRFNFKF